MQLHEVLTWLMNAGAGVAVFFIIDLTERSKAQWLAGVRAWLLAMESDNKRWLAYVLAGVVAVLAYLVSVAFQFNAAPGDVRDWANTLFAVAASAIIASQIAHGGIALRRDSN